MSGLSDEKDLNDDELARLRLIASRSLLGERRRGLRRGFLVDSIVAVLARHGGRSEKYLRTTVRELWGTTTITEVIFGQALDEAISAGLVSRQRTVDDNERLVASADAVEDVKVDRDWVDRTFEKFIREIRLRVVGFPHEEYLQRKAAEVADRVTEAIAHAMAGYETMGGREPEFVRPTKLDLAALRRYCMEISDEKLRNPVGSLAEACLDDVDVFGDAIVHLVIVGSIVHGLVAQRVASSTRPSLNSTRLLLDASVLIDLAAHESDPGRSVLVEMIEGSRRLDVAVCVGDHTIQEWNGLWRGADKEIADFAGSDSIELPPEVYRWISNPFVERYFEFRALGGREPWAQWSKPRRPLSPTLKRLGVDCISTVPSTDDARFRSELQSLNERKRGSRRHARALDADARSCALIAEWRKAGETAYFVSTDGMSPVAFERATGDSLSLTVDPRSWALYVTHLLTDDPDATIKVASLIGRVVARDALFSVAGSYPLDSIVEFVEILSEQGSSITAEEVRGLDESQTEIFDTLRALTEEAERDPDVTGAAIARRLATRRLGRAEIERRRQAERDRQHAEEVAALAADRDAQIADKTRLAADLAASMANTQTAMHAAEQKEITGRRRRKVWTTAVVSSVLIIASARSGLVSAVGLIVGLLAVCAYLGQGLSWADKPQEPERALRHSLLAVLAVEAVALILGQIGP